MLLLLVIFSMTMGGCAKNFIEPMTAKDFVAEVEKDVKRVDVGEAKALIDQGYVIVDAREPHEYKKGHIQGAINIPRGIMEWNIEKKITDKNTKILTYCRLGGRSCLAAYSLQRMGYANVVNMDGLFKDWIQAGYPVE